MDNKFKFQYNKPKIKQNNVIIKKDINKNNSIESNKNINIVNKPNFKSLNINLFNFKKEKISNSLFFNRNINIYRENLYTIQNNNENIITKSDDNNKKLINENLNVNLIDHSGVYIQLNHDALYNVNQNLSHLLNILANNTSNDLPTNNIFFDNSRNIIFDINTFTNTFNLNDFSMNPFNILINSSTFNITLVQYLLNWKSNADISQNTLPYINNYVNFGDLSLNLINYNLLNLVINHQNLHNYLCMVMYFDLYQHYFSN